MAGPPPPPPPPRFYPPPPPGPPLPSPPAWGPPPPGYPGGLISPGEMVGAVRQIRSGLRYYQIYLVLLLLLAVATAAVAVTENAPAFLGTSVPSSIWDANATANTTGPAAGAPLWAGAIEGVFGLGAFIVLLLAWIDWRGGVRRLPESARAYGPAQVESAGKAEGDYSRTVVTFIVSLVLAIVLAAAIVFIVVSSVLGCATTVNCNTGTTVGAVRTELIVAVAAIVLFSTVIVVVAYHFATRSFKEAIQTVATPEINLALDQGRQFVLIGAVLSATNLLSLLYIPLALVGAISPILILYGFGKIVGAYDAWLARPPSPGLPGAGGVVVGWGASRR